MKKITSVLLELILVMSFSLTGYHSRTESKADMADAVSGALAKQGATPSEERKSENEDKKIDKCAPISRATIGSGVAPSEEYGPQNNDEMTKPSVPQNENRIEAHQPEQTMNELKIIAEGVPVEVRLASDGQYSYAYNKDEYAVTTTVNGSTFEIKVTAIRPEIGSGNQTNVIVYIPNQNYTLITGASTGSSLILPTINANITVTSNASSVVVNLPSDYDKTLNYTGNASSCSLSKGDIYDFAVSAKISTSAVFVPNDWPAYDMLSPSYNYTSGDGTAKINIDVTSGSFVFE